MKFLLSLSILLMSIATDAQPIDTTEWNAYMKNTQLYWDSLGSDYYDGIIAGNGRLGVNAYREGEKAIRFDVGRSDVTDQRPHYPDSMFTQQLVSRPRLPIGKILCRPARVQSLRHAIRFRGDPKTTNGNSEKEHHYGTTGRRAQTVP